MKFLIFILVGVLPLAAGVRVGTSPVSRVVELLNNLVEKSEEELKTEEDLFEKFECWAKTIINTKTASNAAATQRKEELEAYIADIEAGRIEFTTERKDLEKEVADIKAGIQEAEQARKKEHEDYLAAKDEMEKGIAALKEAIAVLKEGTNEKKEGLISVSSQLNQGFRARAAEAKSLQRAVEVSNRYLSRGDAFFLRKLLTGHIHMQPDSDKDYKHLEQKATFKQKYETRSGNIKETLIRLLANFEAKLKETEEKEAKSLAIYDKLMASKEEQLAKSEEALTSLVKEQGARDLTKSEAKQEIDDLTTQMENDEKFIKETKATLKTKTEEWKDRKELRLAEIEAMNKAIAILHGDDNRDLFKRSFASQGYDFVQTHSATHARSKRSLNSAVDVLRATALATKDTRLVALASRLSQATGGEFDAVLEAIDTMITTLKEEEDSDLKIKESCESDRMKDMREAIVTGRAMDELTDTVTRLVDEIAALEKEIEEKKEEVVKIKVQLNETEKMRTEQHEEWLKSDKDDADAALVVESAIEVLQKFYADNGLMLLSRTHHGRQTPEVVAGEAPPPPPATWDKPYEGQQESSKGIIAILELVHEDILKDQSKAKAEEDEAEEEYQAFVKESNEQIKTIEDSITGLETTKADKESKVTSTKEDRASKKEVLTTVMKRIKDAQPGCDFFLVNYKLRLVNRQKEIDGLEAAKGILENYEPKAPADEGL